MIKKLQKLASYFPKKLYAVGGFVRDIIMGREPHDIDLAADVSPDEVFCALKDSPFSVKTTSKKLMTLKIIGEGQEYEYTAFRVDSYTDGHSPSVVKRTDDILADALRRDFTMNAVYYDIAEERIVDPLGGMRDIEEKIVKMTRESTFEEDGLRLMRLIRQAAELGFSIEQNTLIKARQNAHKIKEISPERIKEELDKILVADTRFGITDAHYVGIRMLDSIGVLDILLPEITLGKGMEQRKDFHRFDVFNHIMETVRLSDPKVRLAALLHDVGKPYCMEKYGKYTLHAVEGEKIARVILNRLRYSNEEIKITTFLVANHMFDLRNEAKDSTIRKFLQKNKEYIELLFLLKQADFTGSAGLPGECPTVTKHKKILEEMERENVPFCISDLLIGGRDLCDMGISEAKRGVLLKCLLEECAVNNNLNTREKQLKFIKNKEKDYANQ